MVRGVVVRELDKGLDISLEGEEADEALAAFRKQLEAWQVNMPDIKPLVLDFGLGDFSKVGLIEFWIANEIEAGYCGKYLFVFDGQTCPAHHHEEKHETFFVANGTVRITCDGKVLELKEGGVLPVPPGKRHSFTGLGPALLLELSTPCLVSDNYFENKDIPIGGGK